MNLNTANVHTSHETFFKSVCVVVRYTRIKKKLNSYTCFELEVIMMPIQADENVKAVVLCDMGSRILPDIRPFTQEDREYIMFLKYMNEGGHK